MGAKDLGEKVAEIKSRVAEKMRAEMPHTELIVSTEPTQLDDETVLVPIAVPACGYAKIDADALTQPAPNAVTVSDRSLENEMLRVAWNVGRSASASRTRSVSTHDGWQTPTSTPRCSSS